MSSRVELYHHSSHTAHSTSWLILLPLRASIWLWRNYSRAEVPDVRTRQPRQHYFKTLSSSEPINLTPIDEVDQRIMGIREIDGSPQSFYPEWHLTAMHMLIMTVIPLDILWGASPAKIASPPEYLRRELDGIQNPVSYFNVISIRKYTKLANCYLVAEVTKGWQKILCFSKTEGVKVQRQEPSKKTRIMYPYPVHQEIPYSRSQTPNGKMECSTRRVELIFQISATIAPRNTIWAKETGQVLVKMAASGTLWLTFDAFRTSKATRIYVRWLEQPIQKLVI